ncbi:hypothetical protein D9M68_632810 [compost metagenome]
MLKKFLSIVLLVMTLLCNTAMAGTENPRPNSLRIIPIAIYGVFNTGQGIAYERQITKKGIIGLYLPVYYGKQHLPFGSEPPFVENGAPSFFFNPGVKFYLLDKKKATLAIGPSYFTTIGKGTHIQEGGGGVPYRRSEVNFIQNGLMANLHIRLNASPRFFMGFDFGMGPCFETRYKENDQLVYTEPTSVYPLLNINLGFRF